MNPITREERFLSAIAGDGDAVPTPITREELFLAKMAGEDVTPPTPITRREKYYKSIIDNGGGGVAVTVEPLSVIENGTITAPSGKAYSPVTVNVPTGGDRPNYLLNDGDAVGTIYFNTEFVPDSFLAEINYDREDPQTGLKWAYICFDYLCAADLSSVGLGEGYIIYWGESGIVPIYSTIAFDASQFIPGLVVEEAGWQVSSYPVNITVSISSMSASFKSVMDYVFAKNSIKFG